MAIVPLRATERSSKGKGAARRMRREGRIPAVIYGPGEEPLAISIDAKEFEVLYKRHGGSSIIVELEIEGVENGSKRALVKDVQRHTVTGKVLHIDLQHVSPDRKITVDVPVVVVGESKGVKAGGVMEVVTREVHLQCLPADIPEKLEVDVTELEIGESVHARDLDLPKAELLVDPDTVIVTVVPPTVIEEIRVEKPAEEPEVVGKEPEAEAEAKEKEKEKEADKEKD